MNFRSILLSISFTSLLLFIASCASRSSAGFQGYDCNSRMDDAVQAYEKEREGEAIKILTELKSNCGGSEMMDTVHYYLGMAHMNLDQNADARIEFERLRREFPYSPFVAEAHFRIGQILMEESNPPDRDQTQTIEAIQELNHFIERYPSSAFADSAVGFRDKGIDKLGTKEYLTAKFYKRQEQHDAALIYYKSLLSKYPSSSHTINGIVDMSEILVQLGRHNEAAEILEQLQGKELDEELQRRVQLLEKTLSN